MSFIRALLLQRWLYWPVQRRGWPLRFERVRPELAGENELPVAEPDLAPAGALSAAFAVHIMGLA